jgi:uncharacterized protein (TIGR02145 family)
MRIKIFPIIMLAIFSFKCLAQTITDVDGNVYNTITIGTQVWLVENLKVTHYNNGDPIPNVTGNTEWFNLTTGAYCDYNNIPDSSTTYGRIYNWYAVDDSRGLCPQSWHVPANTEWTKLTTFLGGESIAGGKLKEAGTLHWNAPNTGATNESGFTALPAGGRGDNGQFFGIDQYSTWYSSTEVTGGHSWHRGVSYTSNEVTSGNGPGMYGFSVRCIYDFPTQINERKDQDRLIIYPNPATDRINITCDDKHILKIQIFKMIGACILQGDLNNTTNSFDLSVLSKGVYIVRISGSNWAIQQKLIKE